MWKKDDKVYVAVPYVELSGMRIHNPTTEQILEAGYEEYVPPAPEPEPKRYSKYKIIQALGTDWPDYKEQMISAGVYDMFDNATYLEEGDPLFEAFMVNVPEELKELLENCLYD